MTSTSRVFALIATFALALFAFSANAQRATGNEPTIAQIYQAANSGKLDQADAMIDGVLKSHPNSAKAHYVKAELSAREGKLDSAKQELAAAEKIAPGLPFAKTESVQALRNQIANANRVAANSGTTPARQFGAPASRTAPEPQRSFPWGMLALIVLIFVVGIAFLRRRTATLAPDPGYGGAYGNAPPAPYGQQPGYGPMYPPGGVAQQPSMGSSIARGLGTGLAVGAGVLVAEEVGRHMFGRDANAAPLQHDAGNTPSLDQIDEGMRHNLNTDMGGDNFGVNDGGGWDGGGGGDFGGGGGDWDT